MRYALLVGMALLVTFARYPLRADEARAQFYTFAQWETLSPQLQDVYIAGMLDAMLLGPDAELFEKALNDRYSACLLRSRVTASQLRSGMLAQASKHPGVRGGAALPALTGVINEMCPDLLGAAAIGRLFDEVYPSPAAPAASRGPK